MHKIAHWLETFSAGDSTDILRDLALTHTPYGGEHGKQIEKLIRAARFRELCEYELDYVGLSRDGYTPEMVYHIRQSLAYFTKLEFLEIGIDKEKAGYEKFQETEVACRLTNESFRKHARGLTCFDPRVESQLYAAQRKIARLLGPVPSYEKLGYRFGPGATSLTKKRMASLREKFAAGVACSEELIPSAAAVLGELPQLCKAWSDSWVDEIYEEYDEEDAQRIVEDESRRRYEKRVIAEFRASVPVVVNDGALSFVPKNARILRCTVTEPPLNGLFQLAVGDHLERRCARVGLNLRDQTRNQRLAREGSISGYFATMDQSSASDMIAIEAVYHLLPLDWADFLARGRTGHLRYKGRRITLEKFSSMGNGYTFPLESIIFWALACAVAGEHGVEHEVSVFGDDVVLPAKCFDEVARLYQACGFKVNHEKSFRNGPFRESCGKDYYMGIDVRPYYQKKLVSGMTLTTLHNFYMRRLDYGRALLVREFMHEQNVIWGPDGYGDGHLVDTEWSAGKRKDSFRRSGWCGFTFDTFTVKPRRDVRPELPSDFVLPTYTVYQRSTMDPLSTVRVEEGSNLSKYAFAKRYEKRAIGILSDMTPLPDIKGDDGSIIGKSTTFPKDSDPSYKRISIYTLGA